MAMFALFLSTNFALSEARDWPLDLSLDLESLSTASEPLANCPKWASYLSAFCHSDGKCSRNPTSEEGMAICMEVEPNTECGKSPQAMMLFKTCPKYKWMTRYPSCNRGYWASGCGQPEETQQPTGVGCFGYFDDTFQFETKMSSMCTGDMPDPAGPRVCPKTKPCPRCKGCKRDGSCLKTCGGKAGSCSQCDSRAGQKGACCRPGDMHDPIECQISKDQFDNTDAHTCALLPSDQHTGDLLKMMFTRLDQLEREVQMNENADIIAELEAMDLVPGSPCGELLARLKRGETLEFARGETVELPDSENRRRLFHCRNIFSLALLR